MKVEGPEFKDVVSGAGSRLQMWEQVLNATQARTAAEVGVWKGEFAKHVLEQCGSIERYYMIDPWASLPDWNKPFNVETRVFEDVYAEAMDNTAFASEKTVVLRGRTKEVIDEIPDESLDFVYIDGDHTLRGITIDLIRLFGKVKNGGLISGDDFTPNPWQHDIHYEPTLVCPFGIYFAEAMDLPIVALPYSQFVIQKRQDAGFSFLDHTGKYHDISLNKLPPTTERKGLGNKVRSVLEHIGLVK